MLYIAECTGSPKSSFSVLSVYRQTPPNQKFCSNATGSNTSGKLVKCWNKNTDRKIDQAVLKKLNVLLTILDTINYIYLYFESTLRFLQQTFNSAVYFLFFIQIQKLAWNVLNFIFFLSKHNFVWANSRRSETICNLCRTVIPSNYYSKICIWFYGRHYLVVRM